MNRVEEIKRLHNEFEQLNGKSLEAAIRIGELLTQRKEALNHAEWLPWIEANLPFKRATATNYMNVYKNRSKLKLLNVGNLSSAHRVLYGKNKPRPKKKGKGKGDPPKGRQIKFEVTAAEEKLVRHLMEKVFHTTTPKDTILAALRYANEHNEAVHSCCGTPVSNGECSCKSGHATQPQAKPSYFGAGGGGRTTGNSDTPQPLGLPVWNFGNEEPVADSQSVESAANDNPTINNGGGLPQTDWAAIFNADAAKRKEQPAKQTTNRKDGTPTPLGLPVWNW